MIIEDKASLPIRWSQAKLGEITNVEAGNPAPQNPEFFSFGSYPFVRVADMGRLGAEKYIQETKDHINEKGTRGLRLFPQGTVLFTKSGMSTLLNQRGILGKDMFVVSHIGTAQPLEKIPSEWIYYFLKITDFKDIAHATTLPSIPLPKIRDLNIPLPPLPEQHRIVAKLEELLTRLDAGIKELNTAKLQLKRYRQSVLKAAFEGNLTAAWREKHKDKLEPASVLLDKIRDERKKNGKYKELRQLDTTDLLKLPSGWVWGYLSDIGKLERGKSKHRPRNDKQLFGGKYPFIQTGDVRGSGGIIHEHSQTYNELGLSQSRLWAINTLCITIAANIANSALLGIEACFPDSIVGFSAYKGCEVKYVRYYIELIKNRLDAIASATAQKNINLEILDKVSVPITSLFEQKQIVAEVELCFSVADELDKTIETNLKKAERMRQSILKSAFEGKLVPQDPRDESAERLLERITAERVKTVGVKSKIGKRYGHPQERLV
jgi:type I restriction enzyme S subunit